MKILSKLTKTELKLNKKRTIGTLIGIILATALITVVGGMFFVMQETIIQETISMTGYYHISLHDINNDKVSEIRNNSDFSKVRVIKNLGTANIYSEIDTYFDYTILGMDNSTYDDLKYTLEDGTYPKNTNEILIDNSFSADNNLHTGDDVTLMLSSGDTKQYKIVGITSRYGSFITAYEDSALNNDVYLTLKHPTHYKKAFSNVLEVNNYKTDTSKYSYGTNDNLLRFEVGAFSDSVLKFLYGVLGIVIGIILITSVFSIRNSFAISVNEKIKTYGMLASIGATKKQIRKMVLLEGFYLGVIGIGIGLVLGNGITYLLTVIVNALADNANLLSDGLFLYYKFSIYPTTISIIVGIVMIYLSTISSSIRASHVSPIQNIVNSGNIKNPKKLRVPFYIRWIFKIGGVLSYKNLKRSKKKYRVTVISLTVSIFIFIVVSSFMEYGIKTIKDEYTSINYDLSVSEFEGNVDTNKLLTLGKSHARYTINEEAGEIFYEYVVRDVSHVKTDRVKYESCSYDVDGNCSLKVEYMRYKLVIYDDNSFKDYAKMIGADYNNIKDKAIIVDTVKENKKYIRLTDYKKDDIIDFNDAVNNMNYTYQVGAVSENRPWGYETEYLNSVMIVLNQKYYKGAEKLKIDTIYYEAKDANKLEDAIKEISSDLYIENISEGAKQLRTMVLIFSIFIYGFIIVVTFIGITSVFNTINSNMELRRREFASLKSIGMTKKEFNNMILLESIFYSLKSLIIGIALGIVGSYYVYGIFKKNVDFGYMVPIKPIIIAVLFIIVLVYLIMKYSISRLDKENIIETIRKENI